MNLEMFPSNDTAKRMMSYITGSGFYDKSYVAKWIFQVIGMEWEDARKILEDQLPLQILPETATWGLAYHEQKYHLEGAGSLEERRRAVIKKETEVMPFIPETVKRSLSNLYGINLECIEIEEDAGPFTFRVIYQETDDTNIPADDSRKYITKIKPSHLHLELMKKFNAGIPLPIHSFSRLLVRSAFYPRLNIHRPLFLDGSWLLAAGYSLDGIKSREAVEFYPLKLSVGTGFSVKNAGLSCSRLTSRFYNQALSGNRCKIWSCVPILANGRNGLGLNDEIKVKAKAKPFLIAEKDVWHLNGTFQLDGEKKLDAEIIKYEL